MHFNRYKTAITRLSSLLEYIETQARQTDQLNSQHKSHRLIENNDLFSQHLFTTQSDQLSLYVEMR